MNAYTRCPRLAYHRYFDNCPVCHGTGVVQNDGSTNDPARGGDEMTDPRREPAIEALVALWGVGETVDVYGAAIEAVDAVLAAADAATPQDGVDGNTYEENQWIIDELRARLRECQELNAVASRKIAEQGRRLEQSEKRCAELAALVAELIDQGGHHDWDSLNEIASCHFCQAEGRDSTGDFNHDADCALVRAAADTAAQEPRAASVNVDWCEPEQTGVTGYSVARRPDDPYCDSPSPTTTTTNGTVLRCTLDKGHPGDHVANVFSWPRATQEDEQ